MNKEQGGVEREKATWFGDNVSMITLHALG